MVLQETWLKAGTIHDNIAYGRPDASREEVTEAAKAGAYATVLSGECRKVMILVIARGWRQYFPGTETEPLYCPGDADAAADADSG